VGKQLCLEPFEDHWALRDYSAGILQLVCINYASAYPDLQPGITRTLLQAWMDPSRSLTTHYGCIFGLYKLGHKVVKALVMPYVPAYHDVLSQSHHL
jgi:transcription initiation factor TFIID subunit 6